MNNKLKLIFKIILIILISFLILKGLIFVLDTKRQLDYERFQTCQEVGTGQPIIKESIFGIDDCIDVYYKKTGQKIEEVWCAWSVAARDLKVWPEEPNTQLHLNLEKCEPSNYWEIFKIKMFSKFEL